jgi:hypothetical protein
LGWEDDVGIPAKKHRMELGSRQCRRLLRQLGRFATETLVR